VIEREIETTLEIKCIRLPFSNIITPFSFYKKHTIRVQPAAFLTFKQIQSKMFLNPFSAKPFSLRYF